MIIILLPPTAKVQIREIYLFFNYLKAWWLTEDPRQVNRIESLLQGSLSHYPNNSYLHIPHNKEISLTYLHLRVKTLNFPKFPISRSRVPLLLW